ncbi:hypothetical protein GGR57DRAFT_460027 [Xylariaceae sp. FL1272]|nr:hypothetical protein GGR57DRAFT_460027 [Xylariaceae sp. FL1272]
MRRRTYAHIQPAEGSDRAGARESSSLSSTSSSSAQPPAALPRHGACVECRARKTKCDGARPICSPCVKRGKTQCIIAGKLGSANSSVEIVRLLQTLPSRDVGALVDILRKTGDAAVVLATFQQGARGGRELDSAGELHHDRLEAELIAHYPKAYSFLPQIDTHALARSSLLRPASTPAKSTSLERKPPKRKSPEVKSSEVKLPSALFPGESADPVAATPGERHNHADDEITLCDERLHTLPIGFWTDLDISVDLAAKVLSLYIATDHPLLGLFNAQLLIDDLLKQQTRFCSRFLFHAIMYLGCQMYCAFDKTAAPLATSFGAEAEKMWDSESDSHLRMAGGILMSISLMGQGKDHAVLAYAMGALEVGHRLGLFATDISSIPANYDNVSPEDERSAMCFAAWGTFNWNVMISVFYRQPGSKTPKLPPSLPIPADRPKDDHFVDAGDLSEHQDLLGTIFPLLCHFWTLVHKVNWIYYTVNDSPPIFLRAKLVEHAFRELIAWVEKLPILLVRREPGAHYTTVFHIWLHTVILDMFKPFIHDPLLKDRHLDTFTSSDSTPTVLCKASLEQLKRLIIKYRSRHSESTYSILWHTGLIYLANGVLSLGDPEWHLYLLLCIYGYERLNRPYRIAEMVTQSLLAVALRDTDMTSNEAKQVMLELKEHGVEHVKDDLKGQLRATFMVDLDLALTNPEAANAESLAGTFEELAIFQDFINPSGTADDHPMTIPEASSS